MTIAFEQVESVHERAFRKFHMEHPDVYAALVRLAREWVAAGRGKLGIGALYERARWELSLSAKSTDAEFKLNNNHRAFYARLIMAQEPDLADLFELRKQRSTETVGDPNQSVIREVYD